MAVNLQSSTNVYYNHSLSQTFTSWPSTLCAWAKPTASSAGVIVGFKLASANGTSGTISLWDSTDKCAAQPIETSLNGGTFNTAYSTVTYTPDVWSHFCVTHDANGGANAYLNGGNKGSDTANTLTSHTIDRGVIGARASGSASWDQQVEAEIAWAACWNVQLTDAEVASLGAGAHPMMIRPQNLVMCIDIVQADVAQVDRINAATWTKVGTMTQSTSPSIIMPTAQIIPFPPAAAPPTGSYTIYENYYRQLMAGNV